MVWLKPENLTDICGHFQIFAASSDICGYLQISAGIFRYLQISPTHQRNIDLSHEIYRKPGLRSPGLSHTGLAWPD